MSDLDRWDLTKEIGEMRKMTLTEAVQTIRSTAWQSKCPGLESLESFGSYTGLPPVIRLLPDGRTAELVQPMSYHHPDGQNWAVPADSKLDGASIPQVFWSLIGGPFEGQYRNASIVHDYYCDHRFRTWQATARMFYTAMRCSGVNVVRAKIMYYAVYRFGPHWPEPGLESNVGISAEILDDSKAPSLLSQIVTISEKDLGLDQIDMMVDMMDAG